VAVQAATGLLLKFHMTLALAACGFQLALAVQGAQRQRTPTAETLVFMVGTPKFLPTLLLCLF
jgi:hypothetical protein